MKRIVPAVLAVVALGVTTALVTTQGSVVASLGAIAQEELPAELNPELSDFWHPRVRQWSVLIEHEAARRELDPDFLASLVWMESRGDPNAVGPKGATGLMQVMPKESGFTWRPTQDELLDPGTNLFWGTRTLATILKQGNGDVFNALAAYNGGWEKTTRRGPVRFATAILRDYAAAVAARRGIDDTNWAAYFAVHRGEIGGPIWVADAQREDVYAYGDANVTPGGGPLIPAVPPTGLVGACGDGEVPCWIGVWLYQRTTGHWTPARDVPPTPTPSPTTSPGLSAGVTPVRSVMGLMAGSDRRPEWMDYGGVSMTVAPTSAPTAVPTLAPTPVPTDIPPAPQPARNVSIALSVTATPEPTPAAPLCHEDELRLVAYPLDRTFTWEGWKVLVYAEAYGGECSYTYAWNDASDVRAEDVAGAVAFEVVSERRDAVIVGTVVVTSGDQVARVGIYVHPPGP